MPISALPTAPSTADPSTFSSRADALIAALPTFVTEANALGSAADAAVTNATNQVTLATTQAGIAATQATNATNQASAAASSALTAGAVAWVSGTTYAIGNVRYSPVDYQAYRRTTAGAGTVDPSSDPTNWIKAINISGIPTVTVFSTAGSTTWTCPVGITRAKVTVIGGGGSASTSSTTATAGGGGGGTAIKTYTVVPGTVYNVVVGAGGAAVATANTVGNNGGASSFSGGLVTTITGNGGNGGPLSAAPSIGGTATNGDINIKGGSSVPAWTAGSYVSPGGSTPYAEPAPSATAGSGFGGGSGGGATNATSWAGAPGAVIIEY